MYEKVRYCGRVVSMAILIACGVDEHGLREVPAIEPLLEESRESYRQLFEALKKRGFNPPSMAILDAHSGLVAAIQESFPGVSWQRCKVHFMRNILAHVTHMDMQAFAGKLKQIWLAPDERPPENGRTLWRKNTRNGSLKRSSRWKTGWKIR